MLSFKLKILLHNFCPSFSNLGRRTARTREINHSWVTGLVLFTSGHAQQWCKLGRHGEGEG
jgi:hypothetical protein